MSENATVICAGCGMLCDDVVVDFAAAPPRVTPHCELAQAWFGRATAVRQAAAIAGRPAGYGVALRHAADLLVDARRPLVMGFERATVEAVREAVAIADGLGAAIDGDGARDDGRAGVAVALRGASTATFGEIRDRSDLVVVWREDPQETHPRLLERLGLLRREDGRSLVVVDERATPTAQLADLQLRVPPDLDLDALRRLHALERGLAVPAGAFDRDLRRLHELIRERSHVAFLYGGGLAGGAGGARRALALHELVRAASETRHVVTLLLRRAAGSAGAEDVLAWQTGFAGAVDLGSGHPETLREGRARLEAGEVDVLLSVESDPSPVPASTAVIAVSSEPVAGAAVELRTARAGIGAGGTLHRMDGVPLTLQAQRPIEDGPQADPPGAAAVLAELRAELAL